MTKTELPSIVEDLASAPRKRIDLKALRSRETAPDQAIEENAKTIGEKWGASIQLPPSDPIVMAAPITSIRGYIPQYLDDELSIKAAERRVTKTFLLIEALAHAGYRVDDVDLVQDRRRIRQKGKL